MFSGKIDFWGLFFFRVRDRSGILFCFGKKDTSRWPGPEGDAHVY